jgi:hypothetical protein
MNIEDTGKQMIEAATAAAKGHWNSLRGFAEDELRRLSAAGAELEQAYLDDMLAAATEPDPDARAEAERQATRRFQLGFENLQLASEGVFVAAEGDAKLAAEAAFNAAAGILRGAINKSIGIALL